MQVTSVTNRRSIARMGAATSRIETPAVLAQDSGLRQDTARHFAPQHLLRVVIEAQMVQAALRNRATDPHSFFEAQRALSQVEDWQRSTQSSSLSLRV